MSFTIAEITREALALPAEEQARLTDALADSLVEPALNKAWVDEIMSRVEDLDSARVKPIPGDEVLREIFLIVDSED